MIDRTIREQMDDSNRSLDILQRVTGDEVLKKDRRSGDDHLCLIGGDAAERDVDQKDLLLSVAIGLSDAALSSGSSSIDPRLPAFGRRSKQNT